MVAGRALECANIAEDRPEGLRCERHRPIAVRTSWCGHEDRSELTGGEISQRERGQPRKVPNTHQKDHLPLFPCPKRTFRNSPLTRPSGPSGTLKPIASPFRRLFARHRRSQPRWTPGRCSLKAEWLLTAAIFQAILNRTTRFYLLMYAAGRRTHAEILRQELHRAGANITLGRLMSAVASYPLHKLQMSLRNQAAAILLTRTPS